MRILIERSTLLKSLQHVHRIVERRNTIAILSNVLLKAEGMTLEMKTTDLDREMTERLSAGVERSGQTTVPAHLFHDIVRKFPEGAEILLELNEGDSFVSVNSGSINFHLQCLPATDFPSLAADSFQYVFQIASRLLKEMIEKVQFAISTEEIRHYLGGIHFHIHQTEVENSSLKLRAVTTDGHRLARTDIDAPKGAENMNGIIVPKKAVIELQRLLEDSDMLVTVEISDTKIRLTIDNTVLTSKLIDGSFPDYQRVIPSANSKKLLIDRQKLLQAVDRVSTISAEKTCAVRLALSNNQAIFSINNTDTGSATETLVADYQFEAMEIGFNVRYVLDIASQLSGENAQLSLSDSGSPVIVENPDDQNTLYVLMPMRI